MASAFASMPRPALRYLKLLRTDGTRNGGAISSIYGQADYARIRRLGAKLEKKIADCQAASPSSWKTPCLAIRIAWQWRSIGFGLCAPPIGSGNRRSADWCRAWSHPTAREHNVGDALLIVKFAENRFLRSANQVAG